MRRRESWWHTLVLARGTSMCDVYTFVHSVNLNQQERPTGQASMNRAFSMEAPVHVHGPRPAADCISRVTAANNWR